MSDLRLQRDAARNERDQLRRENQNLRSILGDIAPEYSEAYSLVCDVALNAERGEGNSLAGGRFESRAPKYNSAAYHLRNEERRHQRTRAKRLRARIAQITGDVDEHTLNGAYETPSSDAPLPRDPSSLFVYFCQSPHGGPIKIGIATDPADRLRALQAGSPVPLKMLAVLPGNFDLERRLHDHFFAWRLHGEWFDPAAEGLAELITRAQQIPDCQHGTPVPEVAA